MRHKLPEGISRESHNVVRFPNGQRFEIFSSRVLITDADGGAQLELYCRLTEDFYDANDAPLGREVYWPSSPKWSDGRLIDAGDATELAKKVLIANDVVGHKIRQIFKCNTVIPSGHYEFSHF